MYMREFFVKACLIPSSIAPEVTSSMKVDNRNSKNIDDIAAPKISYLSPKIIIVSNLILENAFENPSIESDVDLAVSWGFSPLTSISILKSILNPSLVISLIVFLQILQISGFL